MLSELRDHILSQVIYKYQDHLRDRFKTFEQVEGMPKEKQRKINRHLRHFHSDDAVQFSTTLLSP